MTDCVVWCKSCRKYLSCFNNWARVHFTFNSSTCAACWEHLSWCCSASAGHPDDEAPLSGTSQPPPPPSAPRASYSEGSGTGLHRVGRKEASVKTESCVSERYVEMLMWEEIEPESRDGGRRRITGKGTQREDGMLFLSPRIFLSYPDDSYEEGSAGVS